MKEDKANMTNNDNLTTVSDEGTGSNDIDMDISQSDDSMTNTILKDLQSMGVNDSTSSTGRKGI